MWAREPAGVFGVESPAGAAAAVDEESASGVPVPGADGLAPLLGLSAGVDGVLVGLCVGLSDGSGFGSVAVLALVTVTVTGAPGPALNVLDGL